MGFPLTPEIKAQLAEQKKECVFCKIVRKEIPGQMVFEDKVTLALLDIYPAVKGHTLFLLKEHYPLFPYVPDEELAHYWGILPQLLKAVKLGIVTVSSNIFIANGGVAGQQAPHVMIHLLPRDEGDGFFSFLLKNKDNLTAEKAEAIRKPLLQFLRGYTIAEKTPEYLREIKKKSTVLFEDDKVILVLPAKGAIAGQLELYCKVEEMFLEKLSAEDSLHFFSIASAAASALFEGLKAQGTNILVKSGKTDDHPSGLLCAFILPRMQNDALQGLFWERKQPKYDLKSIEGKIKDKTWKVKSVAVKKEEKKAIVEEKKVSEKPKTIRDEIKEAMEKVR